MRVFSPPWPLWSSPTLPAGYPCMLLPHSKGWTCSAEAGHKSWHVPHTSGARGHQAHPCTAPHMPIPSLNRVFLPLKALMSEYLIFCWTKMSNSCSLNIKQNAVGNVKSSHFALIAHTSLGKGLAVESHWVRNCWGWRRGSSSQPWLSPCLLHTTAPRAAVFWI